MFVYGARICPFSGDIKNVKDDLSLVKPTFFMSVPRLYNRFYDAVRDKFNKTEGWKKGLLDKALESKLHTVRETGQYTHMIYDRLVFNKTKELFGGNCRFMASGSAPLTPEVHSFMKVIGCAPLMEGYGQTESTGFSFMSSASDPQVGHVGGPSVMFV
jgi:long-chain acyl-CoA synthetase